MGTRCCSCFYAVGIKSLFSASTPGNRERPRCSVIKSCYEHGKAIHLPNINQDIPHDHILFKSQCEGFYCCDLGQCSLEGRTAADDSGVI
ncbi:hypothetical protein NPIL_58871 [Nephila pilipes]|uniref:Uncharacterized protein n=1 Tax=Nephila pilipes TaxID=299642 RepID=A0A8X6PMR3_NEPPI|nr:hypothetical protein NPIL_58871 [Nephila pilipes]